VHVHTCAHTWSIHVHTQITRTHATCAQAITHTRTPAIYTHSHGALLPANSYKHIYAHTCAHIGSCITMSTGGQQGPSVPNACRCHHRPLTHTAFRDSRGQLDLGTQVFFPLPMGFWTIGSKHHIVYMSVWAHPGSPCLQLGDMGGGTEAWPEVGRLHIGSLLLQKAFRQEGKTLSMVIQRESRCYVIVVTIYHYAINTIAIIIIIRNVCLCSDGLNTYQLIQSSQYCRRHGLT
jgi:hypothetical protein